MLKWKLEKTIEDLNKMVYRHTHDLDGDLIELDTTEQYIVDECVRLKDLLELIYVPENEQID